MSVGMVRRALGVGLCVSLCACGGKGSPSGPAPARVAGQVALPGGIAQAMSAYRVAGVYGDAAIDAGGAFSILDPDEGVLPIELVDEQGRVVLLGLVRDGAAEVSVRTTAVVLLYYALGGFTLPAAHEAELYRLLEAAAPVEDVAAAIETSLAADPLAITTGDAHITDALQGARSAVLKDASPNGTGKTIAALAAHDDSGSPLLVEPGGSAMQSGVRVLQNPAGTGIVVQNSYRRYATFLVYRTGTADDQGRQTAITPPAPLGAAHDMGSTSRLDLFGAIGDVLSGSAPFSPVTTAPVDLPAVPGAARTFYDVIVLGPAFESVYPPVWQDSRYFGYAAGWGQQIERLSYKMFWLDFAWPAIETFLFVKGGAVQQAKLDKFVTDSKALFDKRLAQLGVYLKPDSFREGRLSLAMNLALNALKDNTFRLEFIAVVKEALTASALNQADFEAMARKLSARASAATILAAVQIAMAAGDAGAVLKDLSGSRSGEVWNVTAISPTVRLDPSSVTVTQASPTAALTVSVRGAASDASFIYRWSTAGRYGILSDVHGKQGKGFDTQYATVTYMADAGAIANGDLDAVLVEVYADDGSGAIAAGATALGRATSQVKGQRQAEGGPVTLSAYPHNQPRPGESCSLTAKVDGASGGLTYRWTTSGEHGLFDNGQRQIEWTSNGAWYRANADATDGQTDWVKVVVFPTGDDQHPVGDAQITIDIWAPTTVWSLCGDTEGAKYPNGPYPPWTMACGWWVKGHGPIMGSGGFRARSGDTLWLHIDQDVGRPITYGPVYVRRGLVGEPLPGGAPVLLLSEQEFTPPVDRYLTVP